MLIPRAKKISLLAEFCSMGDFICAMPITQALIREDRLYKILMYSDKVELAKLAGIDPDFIVDFSKTKRIKFDHKGLFVAKMYAEGRAPYRIHLIDYSSYNACETILKPEENCVKVVQSLLPPNPITDNKYVVLSPVYVEKSRSMTIESFLVMKRYLLDKGYKVIILGKDTIMYTIKYKEYDFSDCLNLIGKTTISESLAIINEAECVIAPDSGLVYLAGMTETPIVVGYTFVDPFYRLPYRHGELGWKCYPVIPRGCRFCSNTLAAYNIEFDDECPLDKAFECVNTTMPEDWIKALKRAL